MNHSILFMFTCFHFRSLKEPIDAYKDIPTTHVLLSLSKKYIDMNHEKGEEDNELLHLSINIYTIFI